MTRSTESPFTRRQHSPQTSLLTDHFSKEQEAVLDDLYRCSWMADDNLLKATYERLQYLRQLRQALAKTIAGLGGTRQGPATYVVSQPFLQRAFRLLTRTGDEHLVYVTGPEMDDRIFALTRLVGFKLGKSSPVQAVPDNVSQLDALTELDEQGQRLLATFHSHPGSGPGSTHPSSTDQQTQQRLEKAGYPTVGAIFSRDGFVRFYTHSRSFAVRVTGRCQQQSEPYVFAVNNANSRTQSAREVP